MTLTEPVTVSVRQAAEILGVSAAHAYDLASQGKLPGAYRLTEHGRVLIHRPTLIAAIESLAAFVPPSVHDASAGVGDSLPASASGRGDGS